MRISFFLLALQTIQCARFIFLCYLANPAEDTLSDVSTLAISISPNKIILPTTSIEHSISTWLINAVNDHSTIDWFVLGTNKTRIKLTKFEHEIEKLNLNPKVDDYFSGVLLQDLEYSILHHYDTPDLSTYPYLPAGILFSRATLEKLAGFIKTQQPKIEIDPIYELSKLIQEQLSIPLSEFRSACVDLSHLSFSSSSMRTVSKLIHQYIDVTLSNTIGVLASCDSLPCLSPKNFFDSLPHTITAALNKIQLRDRYLCSIWSVDLGALSTASTSFEKLDYILLDALYENYEFFSARPLSTVQDLKTLLMERNSFGHYNWINTALQSHYADQSSRRGGENQIVPKEASSALSPPSALAGGSQLVSFFMNLANSLTSSERRSGTWIDQIIYFFTKSADESWSFNSIVEGSNATMEEGVIESNQKPVIHLLPNVYILVKSGKKTIQRMNSYTLPWLYVASQLGATALIFTDEGCELKAEERGGEEVRSVKEEEKRGVDAWRVEEKVVSDERKARENREKKDKGESMKRDKNQAKEEKQSLCECTDKKSFDDTIELLKNGFFHIPLGRDTETTVGHCAKMRCLLEYTSVNMESITALYSLRYKGNSSNSANNAPPVPKNSTKSPTNVPLFLLIDDDTMISISNLIVLIAKIRKLRMKKLYLGRMYSYSRANTLGHDGYDYITSGGGMILDVHSINEFAATYHCPSPSFPDDMYLGNVATAKKMTVAQSFSFNQSTYEAVHPLFVLKNNLSFHGNTKSKLKQLMLLALNGTGHLLLSKLIRPQP